MADTGEVVKYKVNVQQLQDAAQGALAMKQWRQSRVVIAFLECHVFIQNKREEARVPLICQLDLSLTPAQVGGRVVTPSPATIIPSFSQPRPVHTAHSTAVRCIIIVQMFACAVNTSVANTRLAA